MMPPDADLQAAYAFTFPYYEMARTRYLAVEYPQNPARSAINALSHRRTLSDHLARSVTTPNNDTLYSSAWLDLSAGPLTLTIPRIASRYWSVQFMEVTTSTAAIIGSRNAGEGAMRLWITHEGEATPPPPGMTVVRLRTRDVWMLVRIVVDGPGDLAVVHRLQDGLILEPGQTDGVRPAPRGPVPPQALKGVVSDGANYLAVVNDMLARNPGDPALPATSVGWHRHGFGVPHANPEQARALTQALPALNAMVRNWGGLNASGQQVQQWRYPHAAVGTYGSDYALRAGVALGGLGALPPHEAIYLSALGDQDGRKLDGAQRYRLRVPRQGIPVQAFWSLSMYQIEADGRLFFIANPLQRHVIGDRTPGLVRNADGSLDIWLQHEAPTAAAELANWLPAPAGPFRLILRAYLPSPALAQGQAELPTLVRLD